VLRSSAAVYFKNLVKKGWDVDPESKETPVAAGDRDAIKSHMVTLVCACGKFGDVKQQLSQALTLIASTDFPGKWPNLLPEIVARFADGDAATVQGMLLTSNSILKRFRYAFKSDALYAELKYALDTLAAPLTRLFGTLGEELRAAAGDAARSAVALESLRLACRVFFSLNSVWKPNLQPDFNMSVFECFDTSSSTGLRELDKSNRFVQKSAESTSI